MLFVKDDGGRSASEFKGKANDCVCRAIAIATQLPYHDVYKMINEIARGEEKKQIFPLAQKRSSARTGVFKGTYKKLLAQLGWTWVPTMHIGQGCKVHLRKEELPAGRLIVSVSRHMTAVLDHVIHDTHDPSRNGTRCVYGYFKKNDPTASGN